MSWEDKIVKDENGYEYPSESIMVCDFCGNKHEWFSAHRSYENPSNEDIQIAKDTDGWINIGIHKYCNDEEDPVMVEVEAITRHMCPDCRRKILQMDENGKIYV